MTNRHEFNNELTNSEQPKSRVFIELSDVVSLDVS